MGAQPKQDHRLVRFGAFELSKATGELRKHGVRIRLQDQPLKLLLCLLETPGTMCSREELIHRIWPEGTFVDYEHGLNATVTRLRQVMGDSADNPRYVETIGRKGYRFIAPVEPLSMPDGSQAQEGVEVGPAGQLATDIVAGKVAGKPTLSRLWPYLSALATALAIIASFGWWRATQPVPQPLLRFNVDLEPEMTPAGPGTSLALSPDGTRLVVAVRSVDGSVRLAIRSQDQSRLTPLSGTEGANAPFFSPDGQWIAYFANGKLKTIAVQGGVPVTLAEASTFARGPRARFPAGSWGDDGNIVAMLNPAVGLIRVPSGGGSLMPLIALKKEQDEVDTWPQVLPGSQAVLFTRHKGDYDSADLEVFSFKTGEQKTVLNGGLFGRYLPSGHLVYIRRNTLFAVPFDLSRLAVSGTSQPVLEDINSIADWSFDISHTGSFAYLSHPPESQSSIFWLERAGRTYPLRTAAGSSHASPRFSPDGKRLAFSMRTRGQQDIWVQDLDRGAVSRLTELPGVNDNLVWTPDGLNLIFRSIDQPNPGIYGVRADGSGQAQRLLDLRNGESPSAVSPDGKRLAIWTGGKIWMAPVRSDGGSLSIGKPELFLQTRSNPAIPGRVAPAFSPDGLWLAYCSNESEQLEVYVVPFPGPGGRWRISITGGMFPAWSRNGRELFFQDLESGRVMVTTYKATGDSFEVTNPHVWSDTRLLDLGRFQSYDVAPDGQRSAVVLYADGTAEQKPVTKVAFLLNFFDELRRRVTTEHR
jgi:serine/threonine-protein kinase